MSWEIKITIDDTLKDEVVQAFAEIYGYSETELIDEYSEAPNPQTKEEFMVERIGLFVYKVYEAKKVNEAEETRKEKIAEAEANKNKIIAEEIP